MHRYRSFLLVLALMLGGTSIAQAQELPLGSSLPMADQNVTLSDGSQVVFSSLLGPNGTVVAFWSNQCPWVDKYEDRFKTLNQTYSAQGIHFVLVNANSAEGFPQESAAESDKIAQAYRLPYIIDTGAALANAFGASRAPHIFSFDGNRTLVYLGSIDDSPGDPAGVQNTYLNDVLSSLATGAQASVPQTKAFGCRLKIDG